MGYGKMGYENLRITLMGLAVSSDVLAETSVCGVPVIQSESRAVDQAKLPLNLLHSTGAAIISVSSAASSRPDVPITIGAASAEAIQQAVSIAISRYPKAKPTVVRSDAIADKLALVSSRSSQLKNVPVIESVPANGGAPCN